MRNRLICFVVIAALLGLTGFAAEELPKKTAVRKLLPTHTFFSPKVDPKDVRMAFCNEGRFAIQLKETYGDLLVSLLDSGVLGADGNGGLPEEVSPIAQGKVFAKISERKGDTYTLLFPGSLTVWRFPLAGVTFLFRAGLEGFLGIRAHVLHLEVTLPERAHLP